jgi:hypothetical protein
LGPIAAKMLETKDAADKAGAASETMAEKLDTQRHSAQAVTQALREYNAEQKKAKESTLESAQAALVAAQTNVVDALGIRLKLGAQLAASLASAQANAGQGTGGLAGAVAQGEVDKIRAAIAENDKAVQKAMNDRRDAEVNVAEEFAKQDADPVLKIKAAYDARRKAVEATTMSVEDLRKALAKLNTQEKDDIKKAQASERAADKNNQSGREVSLSEAMSIAQGAGFRVTSGQRSYASEGSL